MQKAQKQNYKQQNILNSASDGLMKPSEHIWCLPLAAVYAAVMTDQRTAIDLTVHGSVL